MKKNISINISGIIFHIEEDGYNKLKEYLESINKYFASYEDSSEIIADIESRIAEIFLGKLDDGKQVITEDDVNLLIETMGTISDFEAIEDDEDMAKEEADKTASEEPKEESEPAGPKKLFRDEKRRILGGVAAGIAHYFGIDPLWVRLVTVLLFLNIFIGAFSGVIMIAYIVLWIVVPGSHDLGEDADIKKMYRDPDNRVLGGVASGIAAYFGTDATIIRLLFVISMFLGGSGLIFYIILWIITPEAKSITEKMQMQGEPVTLSNIEQNVKESLNVKGEEESALVKILLFPFRVIAAIFSAIGNLLGPASKFLVEALRVFAGLFVTGLGLLILVCLIISTGVILGVISNWGGMVHVSDLPLHTIRESFPTFGYISIFIATFVPFLGLTLLGISILVKRFVINAAVGWSIFGLWVISMIGIAFTVPSIVRDFRSEGEFRETRTFDFKDQVPVLKLNDIGIEDYNMTTLKLRGHADSVYKLDMQFQAYGSSRREAVENAQMVTYGVLKNGNDLLFDSGIEFKDEAIFRAQELSMVLYIPYEQEFRMDEDLQHILRYTINRNGYRVWQMEGNRWLFNEDGLNCLTCKKSYSERSKKRSRDRDEDRYRDRRKQRSSRNYGGESMDFDIEDFSKIEAKGNFDVFLTQGNDYSIELKGDKRYLRRAYVKKFNDILEINYSQRRFHFFRDLKEENRVRVYITLPSLEAIEGEGACGFTIDDFELEKFRIDLSGASEVQANINADDVDLVLTGLSRADLSGRTEYFDARLTGASVLRAYDMDTESTDISASDGSSARVRVNDKLYVDASGMSKVKYKGEAEVTYDEDGFSSVSRSYD